jgi:uncharacterized membrane protein
VELWRLLAHNHWITLSLKGYEVKICARCSGYLLGFTAPHLGYRILGIDSPIFIDPFWQLVCFLLALPLAVDWITQSWGLRRSNNRVRLLSGIFVGLGLFMFMGLGISLENKRVIFILATLMVTLIGEFGKSLITWREEYF